MWIFQLAPSKLLNMLNNSGKIFLLNNFIKNERLRKKIFQFILFITNKQWSTFFCRDSYWPGGILAEENAERPVDVKQRLRMVTKAKMFGSIPGIFYRFFYLLLLCWDDFFIFICFFYRWFEKISWSWKCAGRRFQVIHFSISSNTHCFKDGINISQRVLFSL